MTLTDLIPKQLIPDLIKISKLNWFHAWQDTNNKHRFLMNKEDLGNLPPGIIRNAAELMDARGRMYLWTICNIIKTGLKVFRPTAEQCLSTDHIDLPIFVSDFKPPFPFFVIELPKEYRAHVTKELGRCPQWLTIGTGKLDSGEDFLIITCNYAFSMTTTLPWLIKKNENQDQDHEISYIFHENGIPIEDKITRCFDAGQNEIDPLTHTDYQIGEKVTRAAINLSLLATQFTTTPLTSNNPKHDQRLKRWLTADPENQAARIQLKTQAKYFEIIQNVTIHRTETTHHDPTGSHAPPKPHWRRGHWRRQSFGIKNTERKLIFIQPVLVRAEAFIGEGGINMKANYQIKQ